MFEMNLFGLLVQVKNLGLLRALKVSHYEACRTKYMSLKMN